MKVLYLTNIPNPYREAFFEQLGRECELTVLYERERSRNRDASWAKERGGTSYTRDFLGGREVGNENSFSFGILKRLKGYNLVVVGCYNSPVEMFATFFMRVLGIRHIINSDGPVFPLRGLKGFVRGLVFRGAAGYLVAGVNSVESVRSLVGSESHVQPYPFSSMTQAEVVAASEMPAQREEDAVLCVGQFEDYKGVDVCVEAADMLPELRFKFVGVGKRAPELEDRIEAKGFGNCTVIPFLQKEELQREYLSASMLVLPSRQECWGLVVNEAAACGTPIVSTWGAGAAVEFLGADYPQLLAEPGNAAALARAVQGCLEMGEAEREAYSAYLKQKAAGYTIENMVVAHTELFERLNREAV